MNKNKTDFPLVSIIIPHWRGTGILLRCLENLRKTSYVSFEVLLINNGSDDDSIAMAKKHFEEVEVLAIGRNLGYAGACNVGLCKVSGKYAVLLNNDAVVTPDWLQALVEVMEGDEQIAACQPKIRSLNLPDVFDYAGAVGGYIDLLGYPFCRGRIFTTLEKDRGQYETQKDIFWASGACCMLRTSVVRKIGLLDGDFFAHMEEIDLNWRMHLAGYRIVAVPSSLVYHQAGSTLKPVSPHKTYLNHRNGLALLLKNYSINRLVWILPLRLLMDYLNLLREFSTLRWQHGYMILRAHLYLIQNLQEIIKKRQASQQIRQIPEIDMTKKFYSRSIVWDYFIRKRKHFSQLTN